MQGEHLSWKALSTDSVTLPELLETILLSLKIAFLLKETQVGFLVPYRRCNGPRISFQRFECIDHSLVHSVDNPSDLIVQLFSYHFPSVHKTDGNI